MKRFLVMLLAVIISCLAVTGCSGASIVGKWVATDNSGTMEFMADGKYQIVGVDMGDSTWKQEGDKITVTRKSVSDGIVGSVEMTIESLEGDSLVLSIKGQKQEFRRAK